MSFWINGLKSINPEESRSISREYSEGIEGTKSTVPLEQEYPSRWITLAAVLAFLVISGLVYAFALISEPLKNRLDLKQSEIDTIGVIGTIGGNSGVIAGIFYNRFGPRLSVKVGMAMTCIGWTFLTGITTRYIPTDSVVLTCCATFIFFHGTAWLGTCSTPLIAQNFPEKDHGKLFGLAKAYLGIGSAFFAAFKSNLANGDVDTFMITTLMFILVALPVFGRYLVQLPPRFARGYFPNEINGGCSVGLWQITAFIFAIYLVLLCMVQSLYSFTMSMQYILFGITMLLWLSPSVLACFCHGDRTITEPITNMMTVPMTETNSLIINALDDTNEDIASDIHDISTDVGMPDIFKYWQFYALFYIKGAVSGAIVTFMDNSPQIIEAASSTSIDDIENSDISTALLAIISFGNFSGRLISGFVADHFAASFHSSFWLIGAPLLMTITLTAIFFSGTNLLALQIGGLFVGIAAGWVSTLFVVSVVDLWGKTYLSGNFAIFDLSQAIGGYVFSATIFASFYDHFANEEETDIQYYKGTKCYGAD